MLRDLFKTVGGIEIYGILSMILFVVFFILLVLYAVFMNRGEAESFSRMPLDDASENSDDIQDI